MTRKQQIREALRLLAPEAGDEEEYQDDIADTLNIINVMTANAQAGKRSKSRTTALKRLRSSLRRAQSALNALTGVETIFFRDLDLKEYLASCDALLIPPAAAPRRTAHRQKLAVQEAHWLLNKYGHLITTTRGSDWHKLSAILYGDLSIDLFNHMRAFKT